MKIMIKEYDAAGIVYKCPEQGAIVDHGAGLVLKHHIKAVKYDDALNEVSFIGHDDAVKLVMKRDSFLRAEIY